MGSSKDPEEILVFDTSKITEEEFKELSESLRLVADIAFQEALNLIRDGNFFGCVHDHFAIALASYSNDNPCGDCGIELPKNKDIH